MKDNKKIIIFVSVLVICLVAVIAAIILKNKKPDEKFKVSGDNIITESLTASNQSEIDRVIKEDLEKNKYSLENAKIYLNPYETSPLSALMIFKTDSKAGVTVTLKGKNNDDLTNTYEKAEYHYIPIYALYQNHANKIIVETTDGAKKEFTLKTGTLEYAPTATVNKTDSTNNSSMYFITSPISMRSIGIDSHGEVRWYTDSQQYHYIEPLDNGHLLIGTKTDKTNNLTSDIIEIDYLGRIYNTYNIDEGYLNNFLLKNDGNLIVASKNPDRKTYSDYILEIDKDTGKVVKTWDLFKMLENIDSEFTRNLQVDYFYNSGIYLDETSNSLILTYWGGEFVVNIDYKSNSIKWIFGNPENFSEKFRNILLKGNDIVYPKGMHSAHLVGNTLKVLDNGYSPNKKDYNLSHLKGSYSSANTYTIDGMNIKLATAIDENRSLFSYALGDYKTLSNNRELMLFGRELENANYDSDSDINAHDNLSSRLIEKEKGETVMDIKINWATYSVTKIDMKRNCVFDFRQPDLLTTRNPSPKEEITEEIQKLLKNDLELIPYEFGFSKDTIEHNVLFMSSDEAKLILINQNNEGAVYTLKEKNKQQVDKIITDLKKGTYYVYILENGTMYKTNSKIEIK